MSDFMEHFEVLVTQECVCCLQKSIQTQLVIQTLWACLIFCKFKSYISYTQLDSHYIIISNLI